MRAEVALSLLYVNVEIEIPEDTDDTGRWNSNTANRDTFFVANSSKLNWLLMKCS